MLDVHIKYFRSGKIDRVPQSGVTECDCSPVLANVGDVDGVVLASRGPHGEREGPNEVEEATGEDFRRELVNWTGGVHRRSKFEHDIRKSAFGLSKLGFCEKRYECNVRFIFQFYLG